jgi:hypothetical protein
MQIKKNICNGISLLDVDLHAYTNSNNNKCAGAINVPKDSGYPNCGGGKGQRVP